MTKTELIDKVMERVEGIKTKKLASEAVDAVFSALKEALANGESFTYQGFGTFKVQTYNARTALNPQTKEKIQIPATKRPKFSASKALKDAVK